MVFHIRAIAFVRRAVAGVAVYTRREVLAVFPVFDNARGQIVMTSESGLAFFGNPRRRFRRARCGRLGRGSRAAGKHDEGARNRSQKNFSLHLAPPEKK
jgi:hypothetical protein